MNRKFIGLTMGMLALLPTLANGAQITMTNP
ncbi:Uncharacterised protein [Klebsiella aerogenes]|nr:Uncharacterised protein [Klebsiella aerogenes]